MNNDLFKLLQILVDKKISFCLQSQGKNEYYNLSVDDTYGKQHYFPDDNLEDIEKGLKIIWGHLLTESKPKASAMPTPPGFPVPR